ncbi:MAG: YqeG family HAD IIIA-type phosphatase [Oscillospiraceae bacterium]|nr:YqeG family HAD IIIA-type phosphatase [Oscillospiraceae bacterium]
MRFSLLPAYMTEKLTDLSPQWLRQQGVKLLMLDFDNTIVPYTTSIPTQKTETWLSEMAASDIQLCVVSNSRKDRVKIFCGKYHIPCITHANKPFPKGIRECLERFQVTADVCALVGDQIFTDTLGANGMGVRPILVKAIHNHNIWLKLRHLLELPFIAISKNRRIDNEQS